MADSFDQLEANFLASQSGFSGDPSGNLGIGPVASADPFDALEANFQSTEQPSYFPKLFSSLISSKGLGSDLYGGTIGAVQGVGTALNNAWDSSRSDPTYRSLPQGVSQLAALIGNFYKDKDLAQGIYDTGKVASNILPVIGPTLYDKVQQSNNPHLVAPTTPEQDASAIRENLFGTLLALGTSKGITKLADDGPALANTLDRKSLGTRASDYGKASETRTIESPDGTAQTFVKASLDDLLENNKLGASRDPAVLSKIIEEKSQGLSSEISTIIKDFDKNNTAPIAPNFNGALQYLGEGKVPADLVESYLTRLQNLEDGIVKNGGGKLDYLQKQKVAFGKSYDPSDKVLSGFNRAIYDDLKKTIEKHVPDIVPLNQELAKYIVTEPIVNRALKASENQSLLTKAANIGWTTGGIGAPTIAGTVAAGPVGGVLGAALGLAGKAISTSKGQSLVAKGIRGASAAADPLSSIIKSFLGPQQVSAIEAAQNPGVLISEADATEYNPGQPDLSNLIGKVTGMENIKEPVVDEAPEFGAKVSEIAADLDANPEHLMAVMNFETGGKLTSDVKNQAGSGATGLIQFMPSTAKELTGAKTKEAAIKILEKMSPVEQLDYVQKYLKPFKGKLDTLEDVYMAVLWPKAVGKDSEYALFRKGTKAYWQNRGLDMDKDGVITKFEAASKVRNYEA